MAYKPPVFNLDVDIYTGPWLKKVLRVETVGNMAFGNRVQVFSGYGWEPDYLSGTFHEWLLLPKLTDVRSIISAGGPTGDIVEIPSGSGRWYGVMAVDDIGKGFDNEHRCASCLQIAEVLNPDLYAGCVWPVPMP